MLDQLTEQIPPEVLKELQEIYREEALVRAVAFDERCADIARFNDGFAHAVDGVGAPTVRFDADHFHMRRVMEGADPNDPEFRKWLAKRDESAYARVKSKGCKIQVGYTGIRSDRPRFHKSYG
jgi:hypothetical protein